MVVVNVFRSLSWIGHVVILGLDGVNEVASSVRHYADVARVKNCHDWRTKMPLNNNLRQVVVEVTIEITISIVGAISHWRGRHRHGRWWFGHHQCWVRCLAWACNEGVAKKTNIWLFSLWCRCSWVFRLVLIIKLFIYPFRKLSQQAEVVPLCIFERSRHAADHSEMRLWQ